MTTPNPELNTACAHSIVAHSTISGLEPGTVRDAWACCNCGARFTPNLSLPMFTPEPSHLHAKVSALCTALAASEARVAELERDVAAKQAQIDQLMMEYCPDEMTPKQRAEWERHQVPVSDENTRRINDAARSAP